MYTPKAGRPRQDLKPLTDSVNMLFDIAIDTVNREDKAQGRRLAYAMRMKDAELVAEQTYNKYNVCPNCHLTLPLSGHCDYCDYVKPEGTCTNCAYNQEDLCLNRKHSEGQYTRVNAYDRCDNWARK